MKVGEGNSPTGIAHNNGQKASWDDFKKEHFAKLLHLYACSNNQGRKGWRQGTWVKIAEQMNAKFPESNISIEQLKQLERDLKKLYKSLEEIVMHPGFEWDHVNCTLIASDAHWQKLFESDPKTRKWHRKILPYYAALDALYGLPQRGIQGKHGSKDPLRLSLHVKSTCVSMGENEEVGENKEAEESSMLSPPRNQDKHQHFPKRTDLFFEPTVNCSPKRSRDFRQTESRNVKENEQCQEETEPMIKKAAKYNFSIAQCIVAYHELSGFKSSDLLHVGEIFKDEKNREVFLAFRKDERAHWLLAMIAARKPSFQTFQ